MNKNKKTVMAVLISTLFVISIITLAEYHSNTIYAQTTNGPSGEIISGTPGEVGTKNNTESSGTISNLTGPETIQSLENLTGSNAAILANDTNISNPNITALDSTAVNYQEACIGTNNRTSEVCP